jgi:DNA-binding transcriptional regulator GbsR (MarR family)
MPPHSIKGAQEYVMELSAAQQTFIAHFGEMGSRWGINRTVGQIYALLYISEKPVCAAEIAETLSISRSNVSMGLKELESWRLTRVKTYPGDRKDYFTVPEDIWEIVRTLAEERSRREIEPTLSMLRSVLLDTNDANSYTQHKLQEMHDLIEMLTKWHNDVQKMDTQRLVQLLKLGSKVYQLYEIKDKIKMPFASGSEKGLKGQKTPNDTHAHDTEVK